MWTLLILERNDLFLIAVIISSWMRQHSTSHLKTFSILLESSAKGSFYYFFCFKCNAGLKTVLWVGLHIGFIIQERKRSACFMLFILSNLCFEGDRFGDNGLERLHSGVGGGEGGVRVVFTSSSGQDGEVFTNSSRGQHMHCAC